MTETSQKSDYKIPTYRRGVWTDKPFPVAWYAESDEPGGSHDEAVENGGYNKFLTQAGHGDLTLTVWRWEGVDDEPKPRTPHPKGGALFLIDIETATGFSTVAAMDAADLMDVLARWAPALQAEAAKR